LDHSLNKMGGHTKERLVFLDSIRGLAAIMVAWYHFTQGNPAFLPKGLLKASGSYGWLGVEVFFVLSGFILPWSLYRGGYRLRGYGIFLVRRMVRLDPPYVAAIALTLLLGYLSTFAPGYRGNAFSISWPQILSHFGFLNAFIGYTWLNPVFWTLAIEFQYYLLIGLLFPLVISLNALVRYALTLAFLAAPFVFHSSRFMPHYACLFLLGILTFKYKSGMIARNVYLLTAVATCSELCYLESGPVAVTGLLTGFAIAFVRLELRPLRWLGTLSYSIYLLHVPLGGRVVNAGLRLPHTLPVQCFVLMAAMGSSLAAAFLFYTLIEKPARGWAAAISYAEPHDIPKDMPYGSTGLAQALPGIR
jgi:peptidoglycan/LPS O-acetylase OafA/YrhL